jgi:CDP-glucose 4,6-dehydratase
VAFRQSALEDLEVNTAPALPRTSFWARKRVLVTGHTGFKGGWLTLWLAEMGAEVTGIALPPNTNPNLHDLAGIPDLCKGHYADIRDIAALSTLVQHAQPEIVFHLAAQPLVRTSYVDPLDTFSTNVMGTVNVLEAIRATASVRAVVMVTTDKVYRNREWVWPYREEDVLGGHDPYSASKAASELAIDCWRQSFLTQNGVGLSSARAGNVIGGGDWSADRLLPDALRAWQTGLPLQVRRPDAVRPWQHVLEPLCGYLLLAEQMWESPSLAQAYNFGPRSEDAGTVRQVVELARVAWGQGQVVYGDGRQGPHEAGLLALDSGRSLHLLGHAPRWPLAQTVERTVGWYRRQHDGSHARALCVRDIVAYAESGVS